MKLDNETFNKVKRLLKAGEHLTNIAYAGASNNVIYFQCTRQNNEGVILSGYHLGIDENFNILSIQRLAGLELRNTGKRICKPTAKVWDKFTYPLV